MGRPHKYQNAGNNAPDIGALLTAEIDKGRVTTVAIAHALNRAYSTTVVMKKQPSIQTAILWEVCNVMKHNFFADIADMLPATFGTNAAPDTSKDDVIAGKDEMIASLRQQLNDAVKERDILLKAFAKTV